MQLPMDQIILLFIREVRQRKMAIALVFSGISIALLAVGLFWPKVFLSSTTILADDQKIIRPLMEGSAVATDVRDHSRIASEVIFSRKIMNKIIDIGWKEESKEHSPIQKEQLIEGIKSRTQITNAGRNLFRIEYKDVNPERAFMVTQKFAEFFITESQDSKRKESQEAYGFIDQQAREYQVKLKKLDEHIKKLRADNIDTDPGNNRDVNARINQLKNRIEQSELDLKEQMIRKQALERQLANESRVSSSVTQESSYHLRLRELQAELENLRMNYHETYPDVVRLKRQIAELRTTMASGIVPGERTSVTLNPVYQQLRSDVVDSNTNIETIKTRIKEMKLLLELELDRAREIRSTEAELAELTRDYEVNREFYRDLLQRREKARLSMNLDIEQHGLNFRVQEPATLPLLPHGLRFLHFMIAGLFLGIAAPLGLIYLLVILDPRVRSASVVTNMLQIPVLASISHFAIPEEQKGESWSNFFLSCIVIAVLLLYVVLGWLKFSGSL